MIIETKNLAWYIKKTEQIELVCNQIHQFRMENDVDYALRNKMLNIRQFITETNNEIENTLKAIGLLKKNRKPFIELKKNYVVKPYVVKRSDEMYLALQFAEDIAVKAAVLYGLKSKNNLLYKPNHKPTH